MHRRGEPRSGLAMCDDGPVDGHSGRRGHAGVLVVPGHRQRAEQKRACSRRGNKFVPAQGALPDLQHAAIISATISARTASDFANSPY